MAATYLGDLIATGVSVQHKFMTVNASGKPTTLGDSPTLRLYVNASVSGVASGLTLTTDFDSATGLNHVAMLVTTSVTGIAAGGEYQIVIATGSVSGVSLKGYPLCEFSLQNRVANANVTSISTNVGAVVTAVNTITPARVTAQGIDIGAIVTAVNTIVPARITAQGIDIGAIVTAFNTIADANVTSISTVVNANVTSISTQVPALITAFSTILPARVTAQGIDVGAIVTAVNTIVPARITAQGIDVGAIVTAVSTIVPARITAQGIDVGAIVTASNTIVDANVTAFSASGLAQLFVVDSGTTFASAVAGSPVKEIADNAGGSSLTTTGIAAEVWGSEVTVQTTAGTFGKQFGGSTALPANVTSISTLVPANVTTYSTAVPATVTAVSTVVPAHVTSIANGIISFATYASSALVNGRIDANVGTIASVTVVGSGTAAELWRGS